MLGIALTAQNQAEYNALVNALSGANPGSGSIVIKGITYVWVNYEELRNLLIANFSIPEQYLPPCIARDGRVNDDDWCFASAVVYCNTGGVQVYDKDGDFQIAGTYSEIQEALSTAIETETNQTINYENGFGIFALFTDQLQVNGPDGYTFVFHSQPCG